MCVRSIIIWIFSVTGIACSAQLPVLGRDRDSVGWRDLTPQLTYFTDTSGRVTIDQILSENIDFVDSPIREKIFTYPTSIWSKITLTTAQDLSKKWLAVKGLDFKNEMVSYLDYLDVYYVGDNKVKNHYKSGLRVPAKEKPFQLEASVTAVPFSMNAGDTIIAYIRVRSAFKKFQCRYSVLICDPVLNGATNNGVMTRFFYSVQAMFFIIGIYVAIFYLFVRRKSYLIFAGFCFLYTIHHLNIFPYSSLIDLLFRETPYFAEPIHAFSEWGSTFFLLLFGYSFSNVKEILPKWANYYRVILLVYFALCLWGILSFLTEPYPVSKGSFTIALIMVLPISIRFVLSKSTPARIFGIGIIWFIFWRIAGFITFIRPFFGIGQVGLLLLYALGLGYELKENERAKAYANQIKKLDAIKSKFFANISHEFRTPLTLILSPLNKILESKTKAEDIDNDEPLTIKGKYIKMMHRNAVRLLELINQILELSKIDQGKLQLNMVKGHIIAHLRAVIAPFEDLAEKQKIKFRANLPGELPEACYDKERLEIIMVNVLSNAFKFTPENGEISVTVNDKGGALSIKIADTGKGMTADEAEKIFERYYQVEARDDLGTGIGLALVKELVELHKGNIKVKSALGEGTTFIIHLPYLRSIIQPGTEFLKESPGSHETAQTEYTPSANSKSEENTATDHQLPVLLIIEDNIDIQTYIADELAAGFDIKTANDGLSGLEMALSVLPDLIISDIMMPGMDGLEMCGQLKNDIRTSHIPIILLTAKAGKESRIKGLRTGADDYLIKPFDSQVLRLKVENMIEQTRRVQEKFSNELSIRPGKVRMQSMDEKFLQKVMTIIEEEMGNEFFSVDDLAANVGFSTSQLNRKLKALVNETSNQLIRHFRLIRAKELIEQKAASVSEIAYRVGFNNLSYFAKSYKETFGILPSETSRKN